MIHHITYADERMSISAQKASLSASAFGMTSTVYEPGSIEDYFFSINNHILTQERGAGYWLWKPYIIYREMAEGYHESTDWILYTDAGVEIINNPSVLTTLNDPIVLFGNMYMHDYWCKPSVNASINHMVNLNCHQVQASAMMFRVCEWSMQFVYEWLLWCQIPGFIDDSDDGAYKGPHWQEHRHDQAILTCLAEKYGIKRHWWPSIYNGGAFTYDKGTYTDTYPPIFHHHRKRNNEW